MDFLKFRSQKMKAAQPSLRSLDSTFLAERWRWRRKHYFPGRWGRECVVVLRKKAVQQRRRCAWQSQDEEGRDNRFLAYPWPVVAVALNLQAIDEKL
jgi:hypothetical protein